MILQENKITLRPVQVSDNNDLAALANNIKIWKNVGDGFPNPYTLKHADAYIQGCINESNVIKMAIDYNGQFVGMIGFVLTKGINQKTAEVSYWIGEPFWGKGITTTALKLITNYAFEILKMKQLQAGVYSYNEASKKVLEKCGYTFDSIFKSVKNNRSVDKWQYVIINKTIEKELF